MVKCVDCGLMEHNFIEKNVGRCLWYKRVMPPKEMERERKCEAFERNDPEFQPLEQFDLKLLLMSKKSLKRQSNRVGRALGFLIKGSETERLKDLDEFVGEAYRSLCNEDRVPLSEYEITAKRIDLVNIKIANLIRDTDSNLMYEWRGALGVDFGKDPNNFFLTSNQRIIWAKHSQYFKDKKKTMFLSIPFDVVTSYIDELIDLLEVILRKAPIQKEILDKRADSGTLGDVGAVFANLASRDAARFIPLCKLAQESQRSARAHTMRKFKNMLEPLIVELTQLELDRPQLPPNTHDWNSKVLFELENSLRSFIVNKLKDEFGKDWWEKGFPEDVKNNALQRKGSKTLPPYYPKKAYHEIYYVNFADYAKIILRKDNWKNIFKSHFKNNKWIDVTLNELNPIRNDIAHNRHIDDIAHLVLVTSVRKLRKILSP